MSPAPPRRRHVQISLRMMLLLMIVFAILSAGMLYASRVTMIQAELSVLLGREVDLGGRDSGRLPHLVFIMFTFSSPLLLAAVLGMGVGIMRRWQRGS